MSREAAVAFLATIAANANLRSELDAHLHGARDQVDAFVEFAARKGHQFAPADLAAALAAQAEMSEEQLDRIAGGFNPQPDPPGSQLDQVVTDYSNILKPTLTKRGL
jgi:predicted ribosomally synthesized peptide with nif11-like leader